VREQPQQATDHREHSGARLGGILRRRPGNCGTTVRRGGDRRGDSGRWIGNIPGEDGRRLAGGELKTRW
jgi:hypothetical protein